MQYRIQAVFRTNHRRNVQPGARTELPLQVETLLAVVVDDQGIDNPGAAAGRQENHAGIVLRTKHTHTGIRKLLVLTSFLLQPFRGPGLLCNAPALPKFSVEYIFHLQMPAGRIHVFNAPEHLVRIQAHIGNFTQGIDADVQVLIFVESKIIGIIIQVAGHFRTQYAGLNHQIGCARVGFAEILHLLHVWIAFVFVRIAGTPEAA